MELAPLGKVLVIAGICTALLGLVLWGASALAPGLKLGRLPGDIAIENGNSRVFFPITTMVLLSLVLSLVVWLVSLFKK